MDMLIGLVGNIGSGKSTAAKYMVKGFSFKELCFAHPLKIACDSIFRYPKNWGKKATQKEKDDFVPGFYFTYREFLQKFGTEFGRKIIQKNLWIKLLEKKLINGKCKNFVISDVRFKNECKFILAHGGILLKIERPVDDEGEHKIENAESVDKSIEFRIDNTKSTYDITERRVVDRSIGDKLDGENVDKYIKFRVDNTGTMHNFKNNLDTFFLDNFNMCYGYNK